MLLIDVVTSVLEKPAYKTIVISTLVFTFKLDSRMGRLSIFSWSSVKGSNSGSDISRSWTLMSRPQSTTAHPGQQKIDSAGETDPDGLKKSKTGCMHSDEGATSRYLSQKENRANPYGLQTNSDVPSRGVLEPIALGPNTGSFSRRLAGFKTLFRHKHRRRRLDFFIAKDGAVEVARNNERPCRSTRTSGKAGDDRCKDDEAAAAAQPGSSPKGPIPDDDTRKVSDSTEKSVNSNITNITVCHHPSKRLSMPIIVLDRDIAHPNPFDDIWEASRSETQLSNPFKEQGRTTESTEQSSSGYSGSENPFSSLQGHVLELSSSSCSSWGCASGLNGWPTPADRRFATEAFNRLAFELFLDPLGDNSGRTDKAVDEILAVSGERLERRRDRFLGRIRVMRSTMHIRSEPAMSRQKSLRRMKTFTALSDRPYLMTSLLGKPLETLARLGGYSFLTLPGDFAPATMSLPVCFVATINYLRTYATPVQNLFADPGNLETATQAYHYFAQQVLSAEKERTKIHMTMRSSKMPEFLDDVPTSEETQNSHVLSVAFTFKALLAGLPGGVLGSVQLWRVLVNIYHGRISPQSVQRTGSCLAGLSAEDYAKVRAISLAIVALTSSMQLNLICGVFGLCSLLLHETERMLEIERCQRRANRRIASGADKLSLERFALTLGPLLIETRGQGDDAGAFHMGSDEIESQRVVTLLIGNWRSISRQLRIWERRGLEGLEGRAQVRARARAASGESEKAVETCQKECI
ncbi:hypothetical protein BDW67DRAFT_175201 [Aspergillus spinulosporus]